MTNSDAPTPPLCTAIRKGKGKEEQPADTPPWVPGARGSGPRAGVEAGEAPVGVEAAEGVGRGVPVAVLVVDRRPQPHQRHHLGGGAEMGE